MLKTRSIQRALGCIAATAMLVLGTSVAQAQAPGLQPEDLHALLSVGDIQLAPNGRRVAYTVSHSDRPGRPYSQLWIRDLQTGEEFEFAGASGPRWSPSGDRIAYFGREGDRSGLMVANADGTGRTFVAEVESTNHPLPSSGESLAWSPDGSELAFISAVPGPETDDANGDPMVISRYLYKPHAGEGMTRFNDNRRVHIFVADIATGAVRQLTDGVYYEHSIDWSPAGQEIVFISNREENPDQKFNYDIFAVNAETGATRQLTETANAEYRPQWSPDGEHIAYLGTTRSLTSSETTMEDTHVWIIDADGSGRQELVSIDNRHGSPDWSTDGDWVYFTVREAGATHLYRQPVSGGAAEGVVVGDGSVGAWSVGAGRLVYALTTPESPAEMYTLAPGSSAPQKLTSLNEALLSQRRIAPVESFRFASVDGREVEAFLTLPLDLASPNRYPLIVMIHGGPHGQQGADFNSKAQIYAADGLGVLMVNYRGSTGYGQEHADAIFGDQNGLEAEDILAGVDAAIERYRWIDPARLGVEGGSYGGQLTNWLITRTDRFKAAIPIASISNLISFNYMAYYHDYLAVEFGRYPHEDGLMDILWERSPLRYVDRVSTPTMIVHGENDNDVPIAEAEQFFIALKDVGVETVMIRYPREGHGVRETGHSVDLIERSLDWYSHHFEEAMHDHVH